MPEPIGGIVVAVISDTELALNIGTEAGVEVGMQFAVLSPDRKDIIDPTSHDVLQSLLVARTIVKVVSVSDKSCRAKTFRVKQATSLFNAFSGSTPRTEKVRSEQESIMAALPESVSIIKLGDPVVPYDEDDFPGIVADF